MNNCPVEYKQTDPRWSDLPYQVAGESATIGGSGCGPTCAAMLIETLTGKKFTPEDACSWSLAHGFKALGHGTYYGYFKKQFAAFGIDCVQLNYSSLYGNPDAAAHQDVRDLLKEGGYIIACMGKGLWTNSGHFVVVWWMDDDTVYILDPASDKPERLYGDADTFFREVKYYWWVDAGDYNKEVNMSYDMFKQYMDRYLEELAQLPPSEWAAKNLKDAVSLGFTDGSAPRALATREQVALMIRMAVYGN